MNPPRTPKKAHDELNDIIRSLSESWALQLPLRQDASSPSSTARVERKKNAEAARCVGHIKFLFFKDKAALQKVVEDLGEYARVATNWKYKPHQEPGTLPQLPLPANRGQFLAKLEISDQAAANLRTQLLRLLEDAVYLVNERLKITGPSLPYKEESLRPRPSLFPVNSATDLTTSEPLGEAKLKDMGSKRSTLVGKTPSTGKSLQQQNLKDLWKSISKPSPISAPKFPSNGKCKLLLNIGSVWLTPYSYLCLVSSNSGRNSRTRCRSSEGRQSSLP